MLGNKYTSNPSMERLWLLVFVVLFVIADELRRAVPYAVEAALFLLPLGLLAAALAEQL